MLFTKALNYIKQNVNPEKDWKVYPTLVYDSVNINAPTKNSEYSIIIRKNCGEIVLNQNLIGDHKINFSQWEKGVYKITVKFDEGEFMSKLLFYPRF